MHTDERYHLLGPESCNDAELLALILGPRRGRSARALALDLLEAAGSLFNLRHMPVPRLAEVPGLSPALALRLHAALAAGVRAAHKAPEADPIRCAGDAAAWFVAGLDGLADEELHVLCLDVRRRPICYRRLTRGTDTATIIDTRQILSLAIGARAHAVVVAHNHPSGSLEASEEDIYATERLAAAAAVVSVDLLDHLIISGEAWISLAEQGHIASALRGSSQRLLTAARPRR